MRRGSLTRSGRAWITGAACLIVALLVKPVQDRIDARMPPAPADPDLLYFSSPRVIKAMALGYDGLLADLYWMRAIQYYGRRDEAARRQVRYKNLPALLDIVIALDPEMLEVYRAGSIFLAEPDPIGAGRPLEAIRLLDQGIVHQPLEWRLPFDKGFVYFWYLRDFRQAGQVWLAAGRVAGAPPWLPALAASALSQGGAVETAKELWRRQLEGSERADIKENARNHLASIQVDEDIWTLEFFVDKYAGARGTLPSSLEDLVQAGFIKYVLQDPSGAPYRYNPDSGAVSLSADTKVRYLALPYDYRESFRNHLERWYEANRK